MIWIGTIIGEKILLKSTISLLKNNFSVRKLICPVCSSSERYKYTEVFGFNFYNCNSQSPLYGKVPSKLHWNHFMRRRGWREGWICPKRNLCQWKIFCDKANEIAYPKAKFASENIQERGLWIDLGAGTGDLLISAKKLGWETLGFERTKHKSNLLEKRG